jgi:hypothetical protein
MADTSVLDPASPASARTWRTGGALLLLSIVVALAGTSVSGSFATILSTVAFSAALLIFALGRGSVTARRPLGTVALVLLAVWLLAGVVLQDVVRVNLQLDTMTAPLLAFAYGEAPLQFILALIAAVQIARANVVPTRWRWVPTWSVLALAVSWLLMQLLGGLTTIDPVLLTIALTSLNGAVRTGSIVLLGVLAILAADRVKSRVAADSVAVVDRRH